MSAFGRHQILSLPTGQTMSGGRNLEKRHTKQAKALSRQVAQVNIMNSAETLTPRVLLDRLTILHTLSGDHTVHLSDPSSGRGEMRRVYTYLVIGSGTHTLLTKA